MCSRFRNEEFENFLSELGVMFSASDDGRLYFFAFNENSMTMLRWLIYSLGNVYSKTVKRVDFAANIQISKENNAYVMCAVYSDRDFDTLISLLPEIKKEHYGVPAYKFSAHPTGGSTSGRQGCPSRGGI